PFFLHNCDVYSDIDLRALYDVHESATDGRIATLAVVPPADERFLLFDERGLCGYGPRGGGEPVQVREPGARLRRCGFTGIHVASPELLDTLSPDSAPSIVMHYLALARSGVRVASHDPPH